MRKTALCVDFDNVYLGLRRIDPHAAERFATDPGRWLRWFEAGDDAPGERHRPPLPRVLKEADEFRSGSNWLGHVELKPHVRAAVAVRPDLALPDDEAWAVVVDETATADRADAIGHPRVTWVRLRAAIQSLHTP